MKKVVGAVLIAAVASLTSCQVVADKGFVGVTLGLDDFFGLTGTAGAGFGTPPSKQSVPGSIEDTENTLNQTIEKLAGALAKGADPELAKHHLTGLDYLRDLKKGLGNRNQQP